jgi:hypothetical protein
MKKTLLLAAALACSGVVAQEKQVWACQEIENGQGFSYKNGAWGKSNFATLNYLVTIDGKNSKYGHSGTQYPTDCKDLTDSPTPHFHCSDTAGGTVLLRPDAKLAVISEGLGGIMTAETRDTVSIRLLQCTKF